MTAELALEPLSIFNDASRLRGIECLLARFETLLRFGANEVLDGDVRGQREDGQARFAELQRQRTTPCDLHRVLQRLGDVGEQLPHLFRRTQVLRLGVPADTGRVGELRAIGDTDARLVGFEIRGAQEAHVVGGHHRNAALLAERHAAGHECFIVRPRQSLQFQVVTIAEQLLPLARQGQRLGLAAGEQRAAHVAFGRARERDESRGILGVEPGALDQRRAAILALEPGARDEIGDVLVSARVLAQQGEARGHGAFAAHAQQHVHADDGFDTLLQRLAIELHHRKEIVLVGDRHGRHAELRGALHQLGNAHHAVLQRELGVQAEVYESGRAHGARVYQ